MHGSLRLTFRDSVMVENIPTTEIECWNKYTAHNWVYDLSRLLDAQNIKWCPFRTAQLSQAALNMRLFSLEEGATLDINHKSDKEPGYIYISPPTGNRIFTEVYIVKGDIKYIRHIDHLTGKEILGLVGEVELRLNAFVTLYFQKFTGVFCAETYQNNIYGISLKPHFGKDEPNNEIGKLLKKIYKKSEINIGATSTHVLELSA